MNISAGIYNDIALRTGGDIYIGVVGPVRTGKSTFIKRFMETLVIPEIDDVYIRERARDELPQSGSGRTITTAEPKFVPEEAVLLKLDDGAECSIRLSDCVGYMVPGAAGLTENGVERMVMTPWYDEEIPITRAAEEGTRRVIADHSTIGILVTTDGSICGIDRADYVQAEERAAQELRDSGKPFMILLNCASPKSEEATQLSAELAEKYNAACMPVNCAELDASGIVEIIKTLVFEFPIKKLSIYLPGWTDALEAGDGIKASLFSTISEAAAGMQHMRDAYIAADYFAENEYVSEANVKSLSPGLGSAEISISLPHSLYYRTISEESGFEINDDAELMELLKSISGLKSEYERVHSALEQARESGYGIVMPLPEEMRLEEPEIVRQGGKYGVRLKASAPSIHMLLTDIETEVSPALGGASASDEIMGFLLQGFDGDMSRIWESNIFGKSLYDIAGESVAAKVQSLSPETQAKLRRTLQRIINEGGGGLICIIL